MKVLNYGRVKGGSGIGENKAVKLGLDCNNILTPKYCDLYAGDPCTSYFRCYPKGPGLGTGTFKNKKNSSEK